LGVERLVFGYTVAWAKWRQTEILENRLLLSVEARSPELKQDGMNNGVWRQFENALSVPDRATL